jgi:hypothetical protein
MTAVAVLRTLRAAGGELRLAGDKLRYRAPRGVVPQDLRETMRVHRDELFDIVAAEERWRRVGLVTREIGALNDRMSALGPWVADELIAVQDLADAVDAEARRYVGGGTDFDVFQAALGRWEAALKRGRAARPNTSDSGPNGPPAPGRDA